MNNEPTFIEVLKKHSDDLKDSRYKAIECLIAHTMLTTGCKIWELELVEEQKENEITWSVRKKQQ